MITAFDMVLHHKVSWENEDSKVFESYYNVMLVLEYAEISPKLILACHMDKVFGVLKLHNYFIYKMNEDTKFTFFCNILTFDLTQSHFTIFVKSYRFSITVQGS